MRYPIRKEVNPLEDDEVDRAEVEVWQHMEPVSYTHLDVYKRQVYAGLCECKDCEYVLIHDGARPFVTEEILKRGLQKVKETGACVIGMPSKMCIRDRSKAKIFISTS